ncbi:molybdate ABC transporter permease subunit [Devosia sp. Root105]|uniref:molybdate ABC transporter permease subunit n=1 Tax=Devosia sp. Root105 TaxID=1736423 RepID=UPI0006F5BC46|nr:molybdate ABC transporter permease subunit [Devosia sp. Root105]KQU95744.1 molybdenum ABC transporter permease [Devosia sp. Root105]
MMLDASEIVQPVGLTLTLALIVTLILLLVGTPIAWWLCRTRSPLQAPIAALVSLPLVLPPTVLGFYLLLAFGPNGPGGLLAPLWGARTLAFSFEGLVIASVLYSLPFMVQPLRTAFEALGEEPLEAAATLGAGRWTTFSRVVIPLSRTGYLTGAILTFAHTVGEFGVVLMIGGNIPGKTKLVSMAIYDFVERLEWDKAHILAGGMVLFAFVVITAVMLIDRRVGRVVG